MQNPKVFDDVHFQDLMGEIHGHAANKRGEIKSLMQTLADMITKPTDAAIIAPLVREFMEVAVKNDEHLVKMAAIMQRLMTAETASGGGSLESILTEDEKDELLEEAKELQKAASKEALGELALVTEETREVTALAKKAKKAVKKVQDGSKEATQ